MRRRQKQGGLSIFEFTIVLALFALLTGSVIQGYGMIQTGTAKKLANELVNVQDMLIAYRERYSAIPGDDTNAHIHLDKNALRACWNLCVNSPAVGDDGLIISYSQGWTGYYVHELQESSLFWYHVRLAGLAPGDPMVPYGTNAVGGRIGITSTKDIPTRPAGIPGLYSACTSGLTGDLAAMVDSQLDDGNATTGKVWGALQTNYFGVITPTEPTPYQSGKRYTICMAF
ncbi:hypothetical protein LE190_14335 [Massilia oculi]|uniref:Prepilin-type N-terminal cleavage/methylation domain-containing protein n=1 Tax=Massilia hydrophila TaxID=3044279 RepID=A0ABS7YBM8_9BURK|nr:type II secretion system GspH family protein [Massilia oculi]MCA1857096.1 hypothetical protein [Massilia oculi]